MNEPPFTAPRISEEDVAWVCDVMKLPRTAFSGQDGSDPRLWVLKSMTAMDVEACPGSGKTTLLVAKLAILARKWTDSRSGLCVLSHTNVARREIEKRLGSTPEGMRLLAYPHFVGTIHGFVNEFLALPWLRSLGYPIRIIDDNFCEQHRRRLLESPRFRTLANYVSRLEGNPKINVVAHWRLASANLDVRKENGEPEFKDSTKPAARQLRLLGETCLKDGYHRHDEMFMWAHDFLDKCPTVRRAIRARFPLLFLDEVQDNSEGQSFLLFRAFMDGNDSVLRQRFGDSNQAIYQHAGQTEGASTDYCYRSGESVEIWTFWSSLKRR